MTPRQLVDILKDQRGVALPLAMLALVVMSVLIIGFSLLSASEPNIANNQLRVAQARAIAEAGMERAIWALNNNDNGIIASSLSGTAAAPYDGSQLITVSVGGTIVGGFRVTVTNGAAANLRDITADGWVPNDTANPRAKQRIRVTASQFLFAGNPPPSALTVRGEIEAGGNATIDSRADTSCGDKPGTWSKGITAISGSANIWGHDNNNIANQGTDAIQNMPDASFDPYTLHNADLNSLKALAKKNGTYYQGTVLFNAGHNLPNGIIYVDTVSGNNIDASGPNTTPVTDFAAVDISGSAPAATDPITGRPTFSGMLIVAGTLVIHGDFEMHGLVYVQNDFTYLGTGTGQIDGAVISQNVRDISATSIDTNALGNSLIKWNCSYAKNPGGLLPPTFNVSPGTYKEVSG